MSMKRSKLYNVSEKVDSNTIMIQYCLYSRESMRALPTFIPPTSYNDDNKQYNDDDNCQWQ